MNEFSLKDFLLALRKNLKRIIINCSIAVVVGLIIGYSIPKEFSSHVSLAPELSEEKSMRGMSSLASLAGIELGQGMDAIGPDLYPDVIATNSFLVELLPTKVRTIEGDTCTYQQYLTHHTRMPWWSYGKVGLLKVIKMIRPKKPKRKIGGGENESFNPKYLTEEEENMISGLRGSIGCLIDDENGVIHLSVTSQDPLVATIMVDTVMHKLQGFITEYRTNKARVDLNYYLQLADSTRLAYEHAQKKYSDFCDAHQEVQLQLYISKREALENELQIAFSGYSQVKQQVQLAQAKVQETTPAFTILENSAVPNAPDSPRKILILFASVVIAFFGTVGWIYFRLMYSKDN